MKVNKELDHDRAVKIETITVEEELTILKTLPQFATHACILTLHSFINLN